MLQLLYVLSQLVLIVIYYNFHYNCIISAKTDYSCNQNLHLLLYSNNNSIVMTTMNSLNHYLILVLYIVTSGEEVDSGEEKSLSRRKRYVVFPEGSSFSIALCLTVHTLTPDNIFTEGVNWGISYDLPNESKPALEPFLQLRNDRLKTKYKQSPLKTSKNKLTKYPGWKKEPVNALDYSGWSNDKHYDWYSGKKRYKSDYYYLQRRHRRDLYSKLEVIMNAMGFDGRSCVLRALCEASQRLVPKGNSLIEEMMRISFSLPLKRVLSFEPEEHRTYTEAHKAGHEGRDCVAMFPSCSFSLIDMALGRYNAPSNHEDQSWKPTDYRTQSSGSSSDDDYADSIKYHMK
ncbi:uncharacterized protein [Prorops nasuta]|uniref:uncharacterized protein n=1 Tax=Prorops nasuta TaxID=863751 RepID=UPI0034CF30DD